MKHIKLSRLSNRQLRSLLGRAEVRFDEEAEVKALGKKYALKAQEIQRKFEKFRDAYADLFWACRDIWNKDVDDRLWNANPVIKCTQANEKAKRSIGAIGDAVKGLVEHARKFN